SGPDPAAGKCTINGVITCTVTFDAATGIFSFPADFSGGTFASATDGTGNLNVAVDAKDAAGNPATQVVTSVAVTRVKWVRQVSLPSVSSTPLLSQNLGLVIVGAGTVTAGSDSIFAIKSADGTVAWSTGGTRPAGVPAPSISSITGNMALDATSSTDQSHPTPILYVNSGTQTFAMHFAATGIDKYCSQAPSTTPVVGSPIIFGGGASAYALAASQETIVAFQTVLNPNGGGCLRPVFFPPAIPNPSPVFDSPSANGNVVFY